MHFGVEASLHFRCFCFGSRLFVKLSWRESNLFSINFGLLKKALCMCMLFRIGPGYWLVRFFLEESSGCLSLFQTMHSKLGFWFSLLENVHLCTLNLFSEKINRKIYLMNHVLILPDWECTYEHFVSVYILFSCTFFSTVHTGKYASN